MAAKTTSRAQRNKDKAQAKSIAGQPTPTPLTPQAGQLTEEQVFAKMGRQGMQIDMLEQTVAQQRGRIATLEAELADPVDDKKSEGEGEAAATE